MNDDEYKFILINYPSSVFYYFLLSSINYSDILLLCIMNYIKFIIKNFNFFSFFI